LTNISLISLSFLTSSFTYLLVFFLFYITFFFIFFFFLMIRRPPRSTLFPSRRSSDLAMVPGAGQTCSLPKVWHTSGRPLVCQTRSEEHTSELQSQSNLVCRLLLEKKKKK